MDLLASAISRLPRKLVAACSDAQWRNPLFKRAFDLVASRFKNRDGVIAGGVGAGLRFNSGSSHGGYLLGTSEPAVQLALKLLLAKTTVFYDVGANVGFHSMIGARLVGLSGQVFCFEPVEDNARLIRHNAQLNGFEQVQVLEIALSNSNCTGRFWISEVPTWGSLVTTGNEPARCIGTIMVEIRRLDDLIARRELPPPGVMKIDVEGGETSILEGAASVLEKYRPVLLIELHGTNAAIAERLAAANYRSIVFGSTATITESPWNAYIAAAPAERGDLVPILHQLSQSTVGRR